jgi:hypothetical protein
MRNPSRSFTSLALLATLVGITVLGVQCAQADPLPARWGACPECTPEPEALDPNVPHMELVSDFADRLPTFSDGVRRFVLGQAGERYRVKIVNPTPTRIEAVISVDGLDAIDGRPADASKRGYIIAPYGETIVDGWRTSLSTVATFRFSSVGESYAGRKGRDRNVGVVGVAFFRERPPPVASRAAPAPWHIATDDDRESALPGAAPPSAGAPAPQASLGLGGASGSTAPQPPRKAAEGAARAAQRPGLGTQFGEAQDSRVFETTFVRATTSPAWISELRYDDRAGLLARGIPVDPPRDPRAYENDLRDQARAFPQTRFAQPPP